MTDTNATDGMPEEIIAYVEDVDGIQFYSYWHDGSGKSPPRAKPETRYIRADLAEWTERWKKIVSTAWEAVAERDREIERFRATPSKPIAGVDVEGLKKPDLPEWIGPYHDKANLNAFRNEGWNNCIDELASRGLLNAAPEPQPWNTPDNPTVKRALAAGFKLHLGKHNNACLEDENGKITECSFWTERELGLYLNGYDHGSFCTRKAAPEPKGEAAETLSFVKVVALVKHFTGADQEKATDFLAALRLAGYAITKRAYEDGDDYIYASPEPCGISDRGEAIEIIEGLDAAVNNPDKNPSHMSYYAEQYPNSSDGLILKAARAYLELQRAHLRTAEPKREGE